MKSAAMRVSTPVAASSITTEAGNACCRRAMPNSYWRCRRLLARAEGMVTPLRVRVMRGPAKPTTLCVLPPLPLAWLALRALRAPRITTLPIVLITTAVCVNVNELIKRGLREREDGLGKILALHAPDVHVTTGIRQRHSTSNTTTHPQRPFSIHVRGCRYRDRRGNESLMTWREDRDR